MCGRQDRMAAASAWREVVMKARPLSGGMRASPKGGGLAEGEKVRRRRGEGRKREKVSSLPWLKVGR